MTVEQIKQKYTSVNQFSKIRRRTRNNREMSFFYSCLAEDRPEMIYQKDMFGDLRGELMPSPLLMNKSKNILDCCRYWTIDYYRFQGLKDLKQTNACHDRFCDNCQNTIAIQRARKYEPLLDGLAKNFDIYHLILTVPNVSRENLQKCIDNVFKQYAYLNRIFKGDAKISGYDFTYLGYLGSVRALEITRNEKENTFHPHLHCVLVLKKDLKLDKKRTHINSYSFSREHLKRSHKKRKSGEPDDYFSDFDILLQKIWRLRIDGVRLTAQNIEMLPLGYSVKCRNAAGNYKEVFKYATKGLFKKGKGEEKLDEWEAVALKHERQLDFNNLYDSLKGRRIVQGYGALNHFDFDGKVNQDSDGDIEYWNVVKKLHELENPEQVFEYFDNITKEAESKNIIYFSRKSVAEVLGNDKTN